MFCRQVESKSQTLVLELDSLKAEVAAAEEAVIAAEKAEKEANEKEEEIQMKVGSLPYVANNQEMFFLEVSLKNALAIDQKMKFNYC